MGGDSVQEVASMWLGGAHKHSGVTGVRAVGEEVGVVSVVMDYCGEDALSAGINLRITIYHGGE